MLAAALLIDALVGESPWARSGLPHPVVLVGRLIAWLERGLNKGRWRRARGAVLLLAVLTVCVGAAMLIAALPWGWAFEIIGAAVLLAHRSLSDHVEAVADGLTSSLDEGRHAVSMIVGRDPQSLDAAGVSRAAIESAAENFSDGVVAPAFWFAVAGLPGIVAYKVINTADSMIGHRSDRYLLFGWAAARVDDVVNLIPARIAGVLIALVGGRPGAALGVMGRDAPQHKSPNAGWPEAAMAAGLGVRLSGPRAYNGGVEDQPWVNGAAPDTTAADIHRALMLYLRMVLLIAAGTLLLLPV